MSRIIAGRAKGRRLTTPKGDRTRPTTDRTREALFSALASWFGTADEPADAHLDGVTVLDLYGGSGAIGLEAASRGAKRVTIVEGNGPTARLIRDNAAATHLRADVVAGKLPGALATVSGPYDLVFADPPYDAPAEHVAEVLAQVCADGLLAPGALVIVERDKRSGPPDWPETFTDTWSRQYGETALHFGATD